MSHCWLKTSFYLPLSLSLSVAISGQLLRGYPWPTAPPMAILGYPLSSNTCRPIWMHTEDMASRIPFQCIFPTSPTRVILVVCLVFATSSSLISKAFLIGSDTTLWSHQEKNYVDLILKREFTIEASNKISQQQTTVFDSVNL